MATDDLDNEKKQIDLLKAKRNKIFARLETHPEDTRLALEIKTIDDQVADCIKQMDRKRKSTSTSR